MKKIVYQIYLPSFKATDYKNHGTLKGVIEKLPYLAKLGIDYLWITPCFKSDFKDNGYDVIDYYQIDTRFGSNDDLKNLIQEAQKYQLKIMLDMVFNHTSTKHLWFQKWLANDLQYQDFYISKYAKGQAPTNWKSKFGGSAWKEYKPNHWYLHLFDESQADLNWDNPKVRTELKKIIKYYVNLGVKGFRFDVINLISKGKFIDDFTGDGRKFYTDGPKAHQYLEEISDLFPNHNDFLTVGELSSTTIDHARQYVNKKQLDSVFTFHHLKIDYDGLNKFVNLKPNITKFNDVLKKWALAMAQSKSQMANFLNNHDQPRAVSRFIAPYFREPGAKMLFALIASLPGIPYIYQGEEIGMTNLDFKTHADFRDVESLNYLKTYNKLDIPIGLKQKSRDNARSPMQWNAQTYSGFATVKPWIKINANYVTINVEKAQKNPQSIWHFYRKYIDFIKHDLVINNGELSFNAFNNNIISYNLIFGKIKYKLVFSFNAKNVVYNYDLKKVIKSNYFQLSNNILKPYQFIIEKVVNHEQK